MAEAQESMMGILRLYELRSEQKMRQARDWFMTRFFPETTQDVLNILEEEGASAKRPVDLHCFGGGPEVAVRMAPQNYYFGYGGAFTYGRKGKTGPAREALERIPRERLLLESDAPYLAPIPHRGKRNEPSMLRHTAAALAEALGIRVRELEELTDANARQFFHRLPVPAGG